MDRVAIAATGWVRGLAAPSQRTLWALVACALVADVVLTQYGLATGATEANPVVRQAVAAGGPGMLWVLKAGAVAVGVAAWRRLAHPERGIVPLGLALPWAGAAVVNLAVLVG